MFRGSYQRKLLTILYSGGSNPLEIWDIQVKNGWTRRVKDEDLACIVFEICGTNVATAYIVSPPDPRGVLGIGLPFITMFIKNLKRYFTFEIQILDDKQMRRRFRFSNYQSSTKVRPFTCSVPLALKPGWNQMQLNLANFTTRAYGTNYIETQRVQIHANCRIRRIYFSDRLYTEEELPRDYRIYLNVRQASQQPSQGPSAREVKSTEGPHKPPSILKHSRHSIQGALQGTPSELVGQTSVRSASMSSMRSPSKRESHVSKSVQLLVSDAEKHEEMTTSAHTVASRKSQKSSKSEERESMSVIIEERESQTPEVEGIEPKEDLETEAVAEVPQESPEETPMAEEEAPMTEEESPRTEEAESPRSEIVESEVAESEPIPESDAEVVESEAEDASPDPPPSPEEPLTE